MRPFGPFKWLQGSTLSGQGQTVPINLLPYGNSMGARLVNATGALLRVQVGIHQFLQPAMSTAIYDTNDISEIDISTVLIEIENAPEWQIYGDIADASDGNSLAEVFPGDYPRDLGRDLYSTLDAQSGSSIILGSTISFDIPIPPGTKTAKLAIMGNAISASVTGDQTGTPYFNFTGGGAGNFAPGTSLFELEPSNVGDSTLAVSVVFAANSKGVVYLELFGPSGQRASRTVIASGTYTGTVVTIPNTSLQLFTLAAANPARRGLTVFVNSTGATQAGQTGILELEIGAAQAIVAILASGAYWEMPDPISTAIVQAQPVGANLGGNVTVIEIT